MKSTRTLILTLGTFLLHTVRGGDSVLSKASTPSVQSSYMNALIPGIFWYELYARDDLWQVVLDTLEAEHGEDNVIVLAWAATYSGYVMQVRCD